MRCGETGVDPQALSRRIYHALAQEARSRSDEPKADDARQSSSCGNRVAGSVSNHREASTRSRRRCCLRSYAGAEPEGIDLDELACTVSGWVGDSYAFVALILLHCQCRRPSKKRLFLCPTFGVHYKVL